MKLQIREDADAEVACRCGTGNDLIASDGLILQVEKTIEIRAHNVIMYPVHTISALHCVH